MLAITLEAPNPKKLQVRNLLDFLIKYSSWLLYIFYIVLGSIFLFDRNPYQHHVFMTSAGNVSASVYNAANGLTSYFNLHDINEDLQRQNADLQSELLSVREQMRQLQEKYYGDTMVTIEPLSKCEFVIASAINNSVHFPKNYITINKGSVDGIKPEMGVVDQNGVVGIVSNVTDHYARVISLLNPDFALSCKVKKSEAFGSLTWELDRDGYDTAELREIPRHVVCHRGDTIVTSGFSAVFPEGIPVGVISDADENNKGNFKNLRVKLFTDFTKLATVRVISNAHLEEMKLVENPGDKKEENKNDQRKN